MLIETVRLHWSSDCNGYNPTIWTLCKVFALACSVGRILPHLAGILARFLRDGVHATRTAVEEVLVLV
jgi:hypothetical protein